MGLSVYVGYCDVQVSVAVGSMLLYVAVGCCAVICNCRVL